MLKSKNETTFAFPISGHQRLVLFKFHFPSYCLKIVAEMKTRKTFQEKLIDANYRFFTISFCLFFYIRFW